jgi:hypothetical protein
VVAAAIDLTWLLIDRIDVVLAQNVFWKNGAGAGGRSGLGVRLRQAQGMHMVTLTKRQFEAEMVRWKFGYAGLLQLINGRPLFTIEHNYGPGLVYLWIEVDGDRHTIVYVGMAKGLLRTRCGQHERGFLTSTSGNGHFQRLRASLALDNHFTIYARPSGKLRLHGEEVPAQYAEERAFIQKFRPGWNSEHCKKALPANLGKKTK